MIQLVGHRNLNINVCQFLLSISYFVLPLPISQKKSELLYDLLLIQVCKHQYIFKTKFLYHYWKWPNLSLKALFGILIIPFFINISIFLLNRHSPCRASDSSFFCGLVSRSAVNHGHAAAQTQVNIQDPLSVHPSTQPRTAPQPMNSRVIQISLSQYFFVL